MEKEKTKIKKTTVKKPKEKIFSSTEDASITYLHCRYTTSPKYDSGWWVNIHRDSYLVNPVTNERIKMIQAINIPYFPAKLYLKNKGDSVSFTLVFPQVPKSWLVFNFVEHTQDMSSLSSSGIIRNDTGIYRISLN